MVCLERGLCHGRCNSAVRGGYSGAVFGEPRRRCLCLSGRGEHADSQPPLHLKYLSAGVVFTSPCPKASNAYSGNFSIPWEQMSCGDGLSCACEFYTHPHPARLTLPAT